MEERVGKYAGMKTYLPHMALGTTHPQLSFSHTEQWDEEEACRKCVFILGSVITEPHYPMLASAESQ